MNNDWELAAAIRLLDGVLRHLHRHSWRVAWLYRRQDYNDICDDAIRDVNRCRAELEDLKLGQR